MSVAYHDTLQASRRLTGFILFVVGVGLVVALFTVKTRAQTARAEMRKLERLVAEEEAAITVLRAEIAYLETPDRLAELSADRLGLRPTDPSQIVAEAAILDIPLREPASTDGEGTDE